MSRAPVFALVVAAALAFAAGCSLLTSFDPEGQPCEAGAPAGQECLTDAGFTCVAGFCTRDAGK